jgi:hypothetical protein
MNLPLSFPRTTEFSDNSDSVGVALSLFCIPVVCQSIVEKIWRQPGEIVEIPFIECIKLSMIRYNLDNTNLFYPFITSIIDYFQKSATRYVRSEQNAE